MAKVDTPPGLSLKEFNNAIGEFRQAIGKEWVFVSDQHVDTYRDDYSPLRGTDEEPLPSAAVAPTDVEKVQHIVRICNDYKIPTWVISSGKNFGYGGPESKVRGSVIIDLKRMNRILDINEEDCTALVEPGVSQYQLYQEIRKRGLKLWIDGPAPAYSSIIANTIEHGVGYGLAGDRAAQISGMEVVLPTGDLIRTGMGALPNAKTWQQYRYGFGPYVDGMFQQANFGIVTKMGMWLIPEPPTFRSCEVIAPGSDDIYTMIDTLKPLRLQRVIENSVSYGPKFEGHDPWDPQGTGSPYGNMGPGSKPPGWYFRAGYYGSEKVVEAKWEETQDTFNAAIKGITFETRKYSTPYDPDIMYTRDKLLAGIPSFQEVPFWNHAGAFVSMVFPHSGEGYKQFRQDMNEIYRSVGLKRPYVGGPIHNHDPHYMIALVGQPVIRNNIEANTLMLENTRKIIAECAKRGYGEYRAPTPFMGEAMQAYSFNNHALLRFHESIKDTLDPNGIFSPGKNGILPKHMREGKV
jgi:4-cresol dehydrogenase (hydroxylating)